MDITKLPTKNPPKITIINSEDISYNMTDENGHECEIEIIDLHQIKPDNYYQKLKERSIMKDMLSMNCSEDIKKEANKIFLNMNVTIKRGKRRKKIVFFCIYQAYKNFDIPCDPKVIAKIVNIETKEITKAFSLCSETETGYRPTPRRYTPVDFIPVYFPLTNLTSDNMQNIIELTKEILEKSEDLYDAFPQTVAASILMYYMKINGVEYDKSFAKSVEKSEVTLIEMSRKISDIHNSS